MKKIFIFIIFFTYSLLAVDYKSLDLNEGDTFCPSGESQCYLLGSCSRTSANGIYVNQCETTGYWASSDFGIIETSCLYSHTIDSGINYYSVLRCGNNLPVSGCPDGTSPDADGVCTSTCQPLSSQTVPLSQDKCVNGASFSALDKGLTGGTLAYQECDSTCYVLEAQYATCEDFAKSTFATDYKASLADKCDKDLNEFKMTCTESSSSSGYSISTSCTPKNLDHTKAPCDDIRKKKINECKLQAMAIKGRCIDNGLIVVENTMECIPDVPDCSSKWHEVLDTSTNTCKCADGFVRNSFGDCWKPLFPDDSNLTKEQQAQQNKAEQDNHAQKTLDDTQKKVEDNQKKTNEKLEGLSNGIAGIRSDLNTTNNLLNKLSDNNTTNGLLQDISDKLDFNISFSFDNLFIGFDNYLNSKSDEITNEIDTYVKDSLNSYLNKDLLGLDDTKCPPIPTISGTVYGTNLVFFSQQTVDLLPMDIFRGVIILSFVLIGFITVFRS